jgi:hypothetical protein
MIGNHVFSREPLKDVALSVGGKTKRIIDE